MLYMVVEHFKDSAEIYRRLQKKGRMIPEGLTYVSSWIDTDLTKCFQLMETDDSKLLDQWMANWNDIVDFEIVGVTSSEEAAKKVIKKTAQND